MNGFNITNEKKGDFKIIKYLGFIDTKIKKIKSLLNVLIFIKKYKTILNLIRVGYIIYKQCVRDFWRNDIDNKFLWFTKEDIDIFYIFGFTNNIEYYYDIESVVKVFK